MKAKKIWFAYFSIKFFYLVFAFLVFAKLTTLGDTPRYFNSGVGFSLKVLYSSTEMMDFIGNLFKKIFYFDIVASLPFMMLSFYGVYYAVDRLNLYKYKYYILLLLSLPNFGVWTSILSKEAIGCFYSGVLSVLIVRFFNNDFKIRALDWLAIYLCIIFKPPYFVFIFQILLFLLITKKIHFNKYGAFWFSVLIVILNVGIIYWFRDEIDLGARALYVHFVSTDPELAQSTRENVFVEQYDFFKNAPYGMFISFFGPSLSEMLAKPTHLLSGLESLLILGVFLRICGASIYKSVVNLRFNPKIAFVYFFLFSGILFVNYPFGILNPGSAVRYRENFYLLFVVLLIYLLKRKKEMIRHPSLLSSLSIKDNL